MSITISLVQLVVKQIAIDYVKQAVIVNYDIVDLEGKPWISNEATFFVTMPPQNPVYNDLGEIIGYEPYSPNWFLLPAEYIPVLLGLKTDADAALTGRFLGV